MSQPNWCSIVSNYTQVCRILPALKDFVVCGASLSRIRMDDCRSCMILKIENDLFPLKFLVYEGKAIVLIYFFFHSIPAFSIQIGPLDVCGLDGKPFHDNVAPSITIKKQKPGSNTSEEALQASELIRPWKRLRIAQKPSTRKSSGSLSVALSGSPDMNPSQTATQAALQSRVVLT